MSCEEARELRALLNRERDQHILENQKALEVIMKLQTLLREVAECEANEGRFVTIVTLNNDLVEQIKEATA